MTRSSPGPRPGVPPLPIVLVALLVAGLAGPSRADREISGDLRVGKWELVWRRSEIDEYVNHFRTIHEEEGIAFPVRTREVRQGDDARLVFFDSAGDVEAEIRLAPDEFVVAATDGSAYLVWAPEAANRQLSRYRYFRAGNPEPVWEASASGEPILMAPDGAFFVMASAEITHDIFLRANSRLGGKVQIVGSSGDVRGELPIYPIYAALTGDQRRVALLHHQELVVLGRDGRLAWNVPVPIDALLRRTGVSQLEAAGDVIVVTGTGEVDSKSVLFSERRGAIRVFDNDGRRLWRVDQPNDETLWFQLSCALSPDGGTLATVHSGQREVIVQAWEARTGELLWKRPVPRQPGTRRLSVAPNGEMVVLATGDRRTFVVAWDREGAVVCEGTVPLECREAVIGAGGMLAAERWVVRLVPDPGE